MKSKASKFMLMLRNFLSALAVMPTTTGAAANVAINTPAAVRQIFNAPAFRIKSYLASAKAEFSFYNLADERFRTR